MQNAWLESKRQISDAIIRDLWVRHGRGAITHIVAPAGGVRNETYIVNGDLVIRFNTLDPQFAKFSNEQAAYDLLAGGPLPVPEVVALDESRSVVPYDYIILTRLPGITIAAAPDHLTPAHRRQLAEDAGRCLAHLHSHTFTQFAKLRDLDEAPFPNWYAYFRDYVARYLGPARDRALLDAGLVRQLEYVLTQAEALLVPITHGVLVHADFHYENILQVDGHISGILDFEWALAGDPVLDFVAAPARAAQLPGSERPFVAGYTSLRPLDADHAPRLALYRLFLELENLVTAHRHCDPAAITVVQIALREQLVAFALL